MRRSSTLKLTEAVTGKCLELPTTGIQFQELIAGFEDYGLYCQSNGEIGFLGEPPKLIMWAPPLTAFDVTLITYAGRDESFRVLHPKKEILTAVRHGRTNLHMHQPLLDRFIDRIKDAGKILPSPFVDKNFGTDQACRPGESGFEATERNYLHLLSSLETLAPYLTGPGKLLIFPRPDKNTHPGSKPS